MTHVLKFYFAALLSYVPEKCTFFNTTHQVKVIAVGISVM